MLEHHLFGVIHILCKLFWCFDLLTTWFHEFSNPRIFLTNKNEPLLLFLQICVWKLVCQLHTSIFKSFSVWVTINTTGSTIRFWHKVKTWLYQMFWQICQKLMLSGFLSSGNLCLNYHLKKFWPHTASTASDRKGAEIQHKFWWFCKKIFFSKH